MVDDLDPMTWNKEEYLSIKLDYSLKSQNDCYTNHNYLVFKILVRVKNGMNQLLSEGFTNLTFVISFCISFGILWDMIWILHSSGIDTSSSRYIFSGFPMKTSGLKQKISVRLSVSWTMKQYPWLFVLRKIKIWITVRYVFHRIGTIDSRNNTPSLTKLWIIPQSI